MQYKNLYSLLLILIFATVQSLSAQDIALSSKISSGSIHLKILPKDNSTWLMGVDQGYHVERRILGEEEDFSIINSTPLKPIIKVEGSIDSRIQERYNFHKSSVEKIKAIKVEGSFYEAFEKSNQANQNYRMYMFITMRDSLLSACSGLEYIDMDVDRNKIYEYRVKIAESNIVSSHEIVDGLTLSKSPSLRFQSKEKSVVLDWGHEEDGIILGYFVERSETGFAYERLTESPILNPGAVAIDTFENKSIKLSFVDSLTKNYQPYYYQLVALDIWGDELPPSQSIIAMGTDQTPPALPSKFTISVDTISQSFHINWSPSEDGDVRSYFITLSDRLNGRDSAIVQDLSPSGELSFHFPNPLEMKNHYFKIGAIDTSGNVALSDPKAVYLPDLTPPSQVSNVSSVVDSNGVVTLSWSPSEDTNMNGYLVFRSFLKESDYIKITDTIYQSTIYQDSCALQLLNKKRFYYVTALDKSFNTSPISEVLQVILPDTVAPSRTLVSEINELSDSIEVLWKQNQSSDVTQYQVYKKLGNTWVNVGTTGTDNQRFMDASSSEDQVGYKIYAVDESGNIGTDSPAKYKTLRGDDTNKKLDLKIEKEDSNIILSWNEIGWKYKIYQEEADGFILKDFVDKAIYEKNNTILSKGKYYIKAYDERGRFITKSKIVQL